MRHQSAFALIVGIGALTFLSGCVTVQSPDEIACIKLTSVEKRILDLYNDSRDETARSVYLQELGEQASDKTLQAIATPSLSPELKAELVELQSVFLEPIFKAQQPSSTTSEYGFNEADIVGYTPKETFGHVELAKYMATIDILCN